MTVKKQRKQSTNPSKVPIYGYDRRTMMVHPVFVVYEHQHVEPVARLLMGTDGLAYLEVSKVRLHKTEPNDPYVPR